MTHSKPTVHHARVRWDADKVDLRAHTVELAGHTLPGSCAPEFGGNPEKIDPEEMLVAALSSCHMLWFLRLAREARLRVSSYEDEPEGMMDGTRFTRVLLRPRVVFASRVGDALVELLHHRAHELCYIANSVHCSVDVEPRPTSDDRRHALASPGHVSSHLAPNR